MLFSVLACREPDPPAVPEPTETGDTALPSPCEDLPLGQLPFASIDAVQTEEDFDFDGQGSLVCQHQQALVAYSRQGELRVVSALEGDVAGIRSLPSGHLVVADPRTGTLDRVDPASGAVTTLLGGLVSPNGLEVGLDGTLYSSELASPGKIRSIDPETGEVQILAELDHPNNMALSPDEQTLYVVTSGQRSLVEALDRGADGVWSAPRLVYEHDAQLGGITTDSCGHVYVVQYNGGLLYRLRPDEPPELLALLGDSGFSSLRFGRGLGGWGATELFATNRARLYHVGVGVPGRQVP